MATYPIDKLMIEYGTERMSPEMAVGHCLQHIKLLHEAIDTANRRRQERRDQLTALEKAVEALRQLFHQWRQRQEAADQDNLLTALSLTVHQLTNEVDSLKARLAKDRAPD